MAKFMAQIYGPIYPLTFHTWLNQKSQICHVGYQKSHNYQPKAIGEGIRAVGAVVQFLEV